MDHQVFISYARADHEVALLVRKALEKAGIRCWIDNVLKPGGTWTEELVSALEASRVVVLIYSAHAIESRYVPRELQVADEEQISILPFVVDKTPVASDFRLYLARTQRLDASDGRVRDHLPDLVEAVEGILGLRTERRRRRRRPINWRRPLWATAALVLVAAIGWGALQVFPASQIWDRLVTAGERPPAPTLQSGSLQPDSRTPTWPAPVSTAPPDRARAVRSGTLELQVMPPNAWVEIDGQQITAQNRGYYQQTLEPREHQIQVGASGYQTTIRTVTVPAGQRVTSYIELARESELEQNLRRNANELGRRTMDDIKRSTERSIRQLFR